MPLNLTKIMTEDKKKYLAPEFKVVAIEDADIISTSSKSSTFSVSGNNFEDEEDW